jgi:hypothetical protein
LKIYLTIKIERSKKMVDMFNSSMEKALLSDTELFYAERDFCDETVDLTDSPAWSQVLKVVLNLLPAAAVFI